MRLRFTLLSVLVLVAGTTAQGQPLTVKLGGTWTLNIAKSKLHDAPPQSETLTVNPSTTDTIATRYAVTGTTNDGKPINVSFAGKVDGQHYPVMSDGQAIAKIAWRRTGARQFSGHEIAKIGRAS